VPSTRDPDQMIDEQRVQEITRLLATAILRLRARPAGATSFSKKAPESSAHPLELSVETRLSVPNG